MALGKNCSCNVRKSDEKLGLGLVRSTSFGRKRVSLENVMDFDCIDSSPTKKQCCEIEPSTSISEKIEPSVSAKSPLETLPQDILIRVLCGVEHEDLKRLFHVSRTIRGATLIAKKWHFEYSTPRKTLGFRNAVVLEDVAEFPEVEAPNAPRQSRVPKSRLSSKKLADISVALFTSTDQNNWPRRSLTMDLDEEI